MTSYDTWKTTNPDDERVDEDRPCKWEKFSGICMVCGAGPDDECEVERERLRPAMTDEELARFDEASSHPYECKCDLCKEWWTRVPAEDETRR